MPLFRRGLLPGPFETEEAFFARAARCPSRPEWGSLPPLPSSWGFSIDWVPLIYSKTKLLPWEGAIFWGTHIQLHPRLKTQPSMWGNSLVDVLHHESIHAAREAFNEPQFEEILAYATASSKWKQFIGPLFTRVWEFPLFLVSMFFVPYALPLPLFFLLRLFYRQVLFYRAKKRAPLSVLVCLTDKEIRSLARPKGELVLEESCRGRMIREVLFNAEK